MAVRARAGDVDAVAADHNETAMSARQTMLREGVPFVFGAVCLFLLLAAIEVLVRTGVINPFIVPKPTEIVMSFERIIVEEN
ncbi:MAG TPA: hypothetical protein VI010_03410, partial [Xanthobacteraceae bacterium]